MERCRYSIEPNAGEGLNGFITNFNIIPLSPAQCGLYHWQSNQPRSRYSNGRFRILANSAILKFYESDAYTCQCDGNLWPVGFEKKKRDGLKNGKTG